MTAEEFLKMAEQIDKRIDAKLRDVDSLRNLIFSVSSPSFEESYNATKDNNAPFIRPLEKIIAMESEVNSEIDYLVDLKSDIRIAIDSVKDFNYSLLLRYRYIDNMTWKQIGNMLDVDEKTARRWHLNALNNIVVPDKYRES